MSQQGQWQVSGNSPEYYERYMVPTLFTPWATDLVERMALQSGERVLDVACGTGIVARLAAHHVSPGGAVTGVDSSPGMVAMAGRHEGPPEVQMDWREGSAMELPFSDAAFNVVMCQQGLQFFPDRVAALREMRRVLEPGGRLGLSVWRPVQHCPYVAAFGDALERHVSADVAANMRAVCALGDAETLRSLLVRAGFGDVRISIGSLLMRFDSVEAFMPGQFAATPFAGDLAALDVAARTALMEDARSALEPYTDDEGVAVPNEAHIAIARF